MARFGQLWRAGLLILLASAVFAGCGTTHTRARSISAEARGRYLEGMDELVSGNYTEAILLFQTVRQSPGYIKYGSLALLRIADALFLQEKYDAAVEKYREFIKQFSGSANVGYARFRIGHAFFEQIPSDWFLAPPVYERQQNVVRHAESALKRFVSLYPTHRLVGKARVMLDASRRMLYEHELYAANFYRRRDKPAGVVLRLEAAFRKFPDLAATEDNFMMLAKAYAQASKLDEAVAMYEAYLDRFPEGDYRDQADESLTVLRSAE